MFVYGKYILEGRQMQNFLWVIYGIYLLYQTMQAVFADK